MVLKIQILYILCGIVVGIYSATAMKTNTEENDILVLLREFQMLNFTILRTIRNTNLMKELFKQNKYVKTFTKFKQSYQDMVIYANDINDEDLQSISNVVDSAILIFQSESQFNDVYNSMKIGIDQRIYFYKMETKDLFESYQMNNIHVKQKLGHVEKITNSFTWDQEINPNFIKRRSNFHGLILKGMTEFEGTLMNARKSYLQNAPYFPNNQTYQVNNYIYGVYQDILTILEKQLNFSTTLYKRKKTAWGSIYPQKNGSYIATGIVGDVFLGRTDIAVSSLVMVLDRAKHVDYLIKLTDYSTGLYVQKNAKEELMDLNTFTAPFTLNVWLLLLTVSFLVAFVKIILKYSFGTIDIIESISFLWTSFIANFGGAPTVKKTDLYQSFKLTICVSLLCGTIVWISYRAKLTSELSVIDKHYPFTDLESFSGTNWR